MQIINNNYGTIIPSETLKNYAEIKDILFIDIETLGLSSKTAPIYLIGCGYFDENGYNIIQWFADSYSDEPDILSALLSFSSDYKALMHFNGAMFDLPFIKARCQIYDIEYTLDELKSIDIYREIKPLKTLLPLNSMRQKAVEGFLGIGREDECDGGELINVFRHYAKSGNETDKRLLLLHNNEDVLNMPRLIKILDYLALYDASLEYTGHEINAYTDYNGNEKKELFITYKHDLRLPASFTSIKNGICIKCEKEGVISFRVPIINTEMKLFFDNYRDYCYLPDEDICVLKSVASGVDKNRRQPARKDNCFVNVPGTFIPSCKDSSVRTYRTDYRSKEYYISLDDFDKEKYGGALLRRMNV